jgi:cation transport regulator ChaC
LAPEQRRARRGPVSERIAVFGYGSLVSRASVSETLGRPAPRPVPARLAGWRRRWSVYRHNTRHEKVFERLDGEPFEHVVSLNVERAPLAGTDEWPNGALVEVAPAELDRLDLRERRYDRIEVTGDVRPAAHGFDQVFTYTAKPEHRAFETPPGSIVMAAYVAACRAAFEELGPGEWDLFCKTTGEPPAPVVETRLVRDEIPPGNPRAW